MNKSTKMTIGSIMTGLGLLKLSQSLVVTSGFFSRIHIFGMSLSNGIFMIPFVIGIVMLFATGFKSKVAPYLMGGGTLLMLLFIIATANVRLRMMSFYSWILLMLLLFGGTGLIINSLMDKDGNGGSEDKMSCDQDPHQAVKDMEKELEELRRKM